MEVEIDVLVLLLVELVLVVVAPTPHSNIISSTWNGRVVVLVDNDVEVDDVEIDVLVL